MKGILRVEICIRTLSKESKEVEPQTPWVIGKKDPRSVISWEKLTEMLAEGKCPKFTLPDFLEFAQNKRRINVPIKKQTSMSETQKKTFFNSVLWILANYPPCHFFLEYICYCYSNICIWESW